MRAGPVAAAGMAKNRGLKKRDNAKQQAMTKAVSPVRPPTITPAALSYHLTMTLFPLIICLYSLLGRNYAFENLKALHPEDLEEYRQVFLAEEIEAFF